jgi:hypothetical protein
MNENIGVGLIVGLAIGTSLYIWNSDNFTKPQKIGLVCCIIFPPMQWGSILLVLAYNKYQSENTNEAKTVKQNFRNKQNLDSTINDLIELRGKGIISEEEFISKINTIENQKTEFDIKNSNEYKQLKNLFDSGILTNEEFENKTKLLKSSNNNRTAFFLEKEPSNSNNKRLFPYFTIGFILIAIVVGTFIIEKSKNNTLLEREKNIDNSAISIDFPTEDITNSTLIDDSIFNPNKFETSTIIDSSRNINSDNSLTNSNLEEINKILEFSSYTNSIQTMNFDGGKIISPTLSNIHFLFSSGQYEFEQLLKYNDYVLSNNERSYVSNSTNGCCYTIEKDTQSVTMIFTKQISNNIESLLNSKNINYQYDGNFKKYIYSYENNKFQFFIQSGPDKLILFLNKI